MPETTPLIKAALNLRVGAGFDVYELKPCLQIKKMGMIFLSGNSDEGIWYDLEQFEYLQMCGMK